MNTMLIDEYKRIRRKHTNLGAKQALLWARGNVKPLTHEWDVYGKGGHVAATTFEQEGFTIKVTIDYDEFVSGRWEPTDVNTGIRNPNFRYDAYREEPRYISLESDSTVRDLASYLNQAGASKSVAWREAEVSLNEEAAHYLESDYCEYVTTATAYIEGVEVGEDSVGGYEPDPAQPIERMAEDSLMESSVVEEAIEQAREAMAKIVAAAAKVEGEWASV